MVAQREHNKLGLWSFQRNANARLFSDARGVLLVGETDSAHNEEREPTALYRWQRIIRIARS